MAAREWIQAAVVVGGALWLLDHYLQRPVSSVAGEASGQESPAEDSGQTSAEMDVVQAVAQPDLPPPPPPARRWSEQDQATLTALQRNCQVAVNNNAGGEYPALQEMACTRYARFAAEHRIDIGPLPAIRVAGRQAAAAPQVVHREAEEDPNCWALIAEKDRIHQRMRQPYTNAEGNYYRPRLHEIYQEMWRRHCKER